MSLLATRVRFLVTKKRLEAFLTLFSTPTTRYWLSVILASEVQQAISESTRMKDEYEDLGIDSIGFSKSLFL